MRRNAFTLWQLLLVLVIIGGIAIVLFPVGTISRGNARRASCQSNLKQIGLGLKQYLQDYDNRFPLVSTSATVGWADSLQPYLKSRQIFQCPSALQPLDPQKPTTDYFYNVRLSKLPEKYVVTPRLTVSLGEGIDNAGTNANVWELPSQWRTDEKSPLHRHLDGSSFGFADGHVKWYRPDKVTSEPSSAGVPTFAIR